MGSGWNYQVERSYDTAREVHDCPPIASSCTLGVLQAKRTVRGKLVMRAIAVGI